VGALFRGQRSSNSSHDYCALLEINGTGEMPNYYPLHGSRRSTTTGLQNLFVHIKL
jgi:hypothetical protein